MATKTLVTAEELLVLPLEYSGELIDGEIVEKVPAGGPHGYIATNVLRPLLAFVDEGRRGIVNIEDLGYQLSDDPDTVLAPDVSFLSRERLAGFEIPERGYWQIAPDLVIEVLSPSESAEDVATKVGKYLAAGVRMVVAVAPRPRSITVYLPGGEARVLHEGDVLEGGGVLPGFALPVARIFERPF